MIDQVDGLCPVQIDFLYRNAPYVVPPSNIAPLPPPPFPAENKIIPGDNG